MQFLKKRGADVEALSIGMSQLEHRPTEWTTHVLKLPYEDVMHIPAYTCLNCVLFGPPGSKP